MGAVPDGGASGVRFPLHPVYGPAGGLIGGAVGVWCGVREAESLVWQCCLTVLTGERDEGCLGEIVYGVDDRLLIRRDRKFDCKKVID